MSRRDAAWPVRPGFTVSMAPEVARRQLRVSLGLIAGFAAVLLVLAASTWASTWAATWRPADGKSPATTRVSLAADVR